MSNNKTRKSNPQFTPREITILHQCRINLIENVANHLIQEKLKNFDDIKSNEIKYMLKIVITSIESNPIPSVMETLQRVCNDLQLFVDMATLQEDVNIFIGKSSALESRGELLFGDLRNEIDILSSELIGRIDDLERKQTYKYAGILKRLRAFVVIKTNRQIIKFWVTNFKELSSSMNELKKMMDMSPKMWTNAFTLFENSNKPNKLVEDMVEMRKLFVKLESLLSDRFIDDMTKGARSNDRIAMKAYENFGKGEYSRRYRSSSRRPMSIKRSRSSNCKENYWSQTCRIERERKRNEFRREQQREALNHANSLQNKRNVQKIIQKRLNSQLPPKKKTMKSRFSRWFKNPTLKYQIVPSKKSKYEIK